MTEDAGRLPPVLRVAVSVAGVVSGVLALGFVLQWSAVTDLWPWPDGRYSYLFLGSIFAAIAAAAVVVWWSDDIAVLAPGALNLTVTLGGQCVYLLVLFRREERSALLLTALVLGAGAVANAGVLWWSRTRVPRDRTPLPTGARVAFVVFTVALVAAALALIVGAAGVFPWALQRESAVMFGLVFLGDACFFAYAVARPLWVLARAQLAAFLAYDLVLIGPFLGLADDVADGHALSLVVYTSVLVVSAAIAVWYLAFDGTTRILRPPST